MIDFCPAHGESRPRSAAQWPLAFACWAAVLASGAASATAEQLTLVPVPAVAIYPGSVIREEELADKNFREGIAKAAVHLNRESVVGKTARRVLLPGKPIPIAALKDSEPVAAGQQVKMIFSHEGIEIVGRATALQPGKAGEAISVRNVDSGLAVRAVVNEDGTVHVGQN